MYIHVVSPGDTVYSVAERYGSSVRRIISDNGLSAAGTLAVGQALLITVPAQVYTVKRGDSLYTIAAANGTTVSRLMQYNPELALNQTISPGQQLTLSFTRQKRGTLRALGYAYPHIDRNTLRRTLPYLTYLALFSYGFRADGSLIPIDDAELIALAYEYGVGPVMMLTTIEGDGGFSGEKARLLLSSAELQNRVLENIIDTMLRKGYLGLDVDFEYIDADLAGEFAAFLSNAAAKLRVNGLFLNVDLAPKVSASQSGLLYEAHDYPTIGAIADSVLLMTYEWGYTYGPPMAVAPIDQVRRVIRYGVSEIPASKIYMGIPNYGYDWALPYEKGVTRAVNIGNEYAVRLAATRGAAIEYDERAQSPFFYYWQGSVRHVVWFEDVRSIEAKYGLISEFSLRGPGYWSVMRPFAQNWMYLAVNYDVVKI